MSSGDTIQPITRRVWGTGTSQGEGEEKDQRAKGRQSGQGRGGAGSSQDEAEERPGQRQRPQVIRVEGAGLRNQNPGEWGGARQAKVVAGAAASTLQSQSSVPPVRSWGSPPAAAGRGCGVSRSVPLLSPGSPCLGSPYSCPRSGDTRTSPGTAASLLMSPRSPVLQGRDRTITHTRAHTHMHAPQRMLSVSLNCCSHRADASRCKNGLKMKQRHVVGDSRPGETAVVSSRRRWRDVSTRRSNPSCPERALGCPRSHSSLVLPVPPRGSLSPRSEPGGHTGPQVPRLLPGLPPPPQPPSLPGLRAGHWSPARGTRSPGDRPSVTFRVTAVLTAGLRLSNWSFVLPQESPVGPVHRAWGVRGALGAWGWRRGGGASHDRDI